VKEKIFPTRVLHVVVGAGNVSHFANSIRSVDRFRAGEIFAVYNWVGSDDKREIEREKREIEKFVSTLVIQQNKEGTRTGSLYAANNLGLERAKQGFDYVNFIQADMQMMWWNNRFLERAQELTHWHVARGFTAISFFTQMPVRGKKQNYYDEWRYDEDAGAFRTIGFADVCLIPLLDGLNNEFKFVGDETRMSDERRALHSTLVYHPYPFIAPIPFPDNVREISKKKSKAARGHEPLLKVNPEFAVDLRRQSFHPLFMEDVVFPNGWACTTPYWPSDTANSTWLLRKWHTLSSDPLSLFEVRKANGQLSRWPFQRSSPGFLKTLKSLTHLVAEEILKKLALTRKKPTASNASSKDYS